MISVEEARNNILNAVGPGGSETVPLKDALGRFLGGNIVAPHNVPPFPNSQMDGFAVKFADVENASKENPSTLTIQGEIPAGYAPTEELKDGHAFRIMTGAVMPGGADTVVKVEDTEESEREVRIFDTGPKHTYVREAGEDIAEGSMPLEKGMRIGPARLGLLAALGIGELEAAAKPKVAVLSTGDELVEVDEPLTPGKIRNTNSYILSALVARAGGEPIDCGVARDTLGETREKLATALETADMVITSGAISVGKFDFLLEALKELDAEFLHTSIAMRPGKPNTFALVEGKPLFAVPGNPVSAMVAFVQFIRPAMRKMLGARELLPPTVEAVLEEDINTPENLECFWRGVASFRNGRYHVRTTGHQGSHVLQSMASAGALIMVPAGRSTVAGGETVEVQLLGIEETF
jgi:molybdopterin molybdotransferase